MTDIEKLSIFPIRRIKPMDGLAVSAEIWETSHQEHRDHDRAHNAVFHGEGIITGLDVIANDPPNNLVYITPGAAADRDGNVIVVAEQIAYDFGNSSTGDLRLLLARGTREISGEDDGSVFIQNEFMIAARTSPSKRAAVELARVTRPEGGAPVRQAEDTAHPNLGELDLRHRDELQIKHLVHRFIHAIDPEGDPTSRKGWDALARTVKRSLNMNLVIEFASDLPDEILAGELLAIKIKKVETVDNIIDRLKATIESGVKVYIEAGSDAVFDKVTSALVDIKIKLGPVTEEHSVMLEPNTFAVPPISSLEKTLVGDGVVIVSGPLSHGWIGQIADGKADRELIRSCQEWGSNILFYLLR